jgi:hypothetical protein
VLEDDMLTSKYFLTFMNSALDYYINDYRVISIHGYVYPTHANLPEAFFLKGADCWGWATWKRGWGLFNPDGLSLLNELKHKKLIKEFDFNGSYKYSKMLEENIAGKNNSWAIRWHASAFLANKLTLYPGRSLVKNIGNDGSGTHCGSSNDLDAHLSDKPIHFKCVDVIQSSYAYHEFEKFFKKSNSSALVKLRRVIKSWFWIQS